MVVLLINSDRVCDGAEESVEKAWTMILKRPLEEHEIIAENSMFKKKKIWKCLCFMLNAIFVQMTCRKVAKFNIIAS